MSIKEICRNLKISRPTLYKYIRQGKIPAQRHPLTSRFIFNPEEIIRLQRKVDEIDVTNL